MTTPADHANTVREAHSEVIHARLGRDIDRANAKLDAALDALQAQAEAADTYKADRDEYDALLGRKMAERDRLAARVSELEAAR